MKTILALVLVAFTLFGCGRDENHNIYTSPMLAHTTWAIQPGEEQTPVVWKGRIVIVMFQRPIDMASFVQVVDYETKEVLSVVETPGFAIGTAFVEDETLYVFGTTKLDVIGGYVNTDNSIELMTTSDLISWSNRKTVYQAAPGTMIWNLSVTADPNGYVMAYDFSSGAVGVASSQSRFLSSADLVNWHSTTGVLHGHNNYLAAVTIRYSNGYYYVAYTQSYHNKAGYYLPNVVSRSTDLVTWESAVWALVSPVNDPFDQYSATDADLVEFNGKTVVIYSTGDQLSWAGQLLRSKVCDCSMDSLLSGLFL